MANTNPQLNGIARRGDVMARGASGWGPIPLVDLLTEVTESVTDDTFFIVGSVDVTKRLKFEVELQTTGKTLTIDTGAQTASRTLSVPVLSGSDTLATWAYANLFSNKNSFGTGVAVSAAHSHRFDSHSGQTGATQSLVNMAAISQGSCTTLRGINFLSSTDNSTQTITSLVGGFFGNNTKGAADTVTRSGGLHVRQQTVAGTGNFGVVYSSATGLPTASGTFGWYNDTVDGEYHGTGVNQFAGTTDATALGTANTVNAGGASIAKTLIAALGQGWGVASTVTATGTTTLAQASAVIQTFTGTAIQTITMPAANLWGAGIAVIYVINNQSTLTVTPTRAGSDTFQGGGTTSAVLTGTTTIFASDGVSVWLKISTA